MHFPFFALDLAEKFGHPEGPTDEGGGAAIGRDPWSPALRPPGHPGPPPGQDGRPGDGDRGAGGGEPRTGAGMEIYEL